jgi:hypothetical protein
MTLADSLLESLESWRPPAEGRHTLTLTPGDWAVSVTADRADTVGCLIWDLSVTRTTVGGDRQTVAEWAKRSAERITGLVEPLKIIEIDTEKNEAMLRSTSPSRKGEVASYYEVLLTGLGGASVRRYRADTAAGGRREQIAFALTHEVVSKLADDLTRD